MLKIRTYSGEIVNMSDEVYVLKSDVELTLYKADLRVRLISGVDGSKVPGYHFSRGYVTVCRAEARTAEFIGTPRDNLRPAEVE